MRARRGRAWGVQAGAGSRWQALGAARRERAGARGAQASARTDARGARGVRLGARHGRGSRRRVRDLGVLAGQGCFGPV